MTQKITLIKCKGKILKRWHWRGTGKNTNYTILWNELRFMNSLINILNICRSNTFR